jgi:hypothetical protein
VSFTSTAPTSLVAAAASTWTIGFTTSASGALAAGSYVVLQLPSGFTTATTAPTLAVVSPAGFATSCKLTGSDPTTGNTIVVALANKTGTCALAASTSASITVAVLNGPAGVYGPTSYAAWTSLDGTLTHPTTGSETITAAVPAAGTPWTASLTSSGGEAQAGGAPTAPASPKGAATASSYLCASSTSPTVVLQWTAVAHATSYVVEGSTTSGGTYAAVSPAPTFPTATSATVTLASVGTEYFKVEALVGASWTSALSGVAANGGVATGYVVTSATSPQCTNS